MIHMFQMGQLMAKGVNQVRIAKKFLVSQPAKPEADYAVLITASVTGANPWRFLKYS